MTTGLNFNRMKTRPRTWARRKKYDIALYKPAEEFVPGEWIILSPCSPSRILDIRARGTEQLELSLAGDPGQNGFTRTVGRYRLAGLLRQPPVAPYPFPKVVITVEDRKKRFNSYTLGSIYGIKLIEMLPSEFLFKAMDLNWNTQEFHQLRNRIGKNTNPTWVVSAAADALYTRGEIDEKQFDAVSRY